MARVSTVRIFEEMKATLTLTSLKGHAQWGGESRVQQHPDDKAFTFTAVNLNARPLHLFPNTQLQHSHQREVTQ